MSTSEAISFSTVRNSSSSVMSRSIERRLAQRLALSCSFRKPKVAATLTMKNDISSAYMARFVLDMVSIWMFSHFLSAGRSSCTSNGIIMSTDRNEAYTTRVYQLSASNLYSSRLMLELRMMLRMAKNECTSIPSIIMTAQMESTASGTDVFFSLSLRYSSPLIM